MISSNELTPEYSFDFGLSEKRIQLYLNSKTDAYIVHDKIYDKITDFGLSFARYKKYLKTISTFHAFRLLTCDKDCLVENIKEAFSDNEEIKTFIFRYQRKQAHKKQSKNKGQPLLFEL